MAGKSTMPGEEPFTTYTEVKPEWIDFNDEQMTRFQQELGRGQQFPLPEDLGASWVSGADLNAGDVRGCAE